MQSFSLRETLILGLHKAHPGRCLCSAKSCKFYIVINWNINYRARDVVYWATILSEPPCNPPQYLPRTFVKTRRLAAFEGLPTHGTTGLCLQWGRDKDVSFSDFLVLCAYKHWLLSTFHHLLKWLFFKWTINTTTLGNEGSMGLKTVSIRICQLAIHAYNSLRLFLTAHPKDLQEEAVMN